MTWDLLIKGGEIADGTGQPCFVGDIAVKDNKVALVSKTELKGEAAQMIDGKGLLVTPGFIDIHRHGDLVPFAAEPSAEELRQGITTFVNGNCGFSAAPSSDRYFDLLKEYSRSILGEIPDELKGFSFGTFLKEAERKKLCSNLGYLVGNGALRTAVKGFEASPVTREEMRQIKGLLQEALASGALGLSLGLMYVPENFYSFDELVEICQVPAEMGKIITAHIRGEGSSLIESVDEIIRLARACKGRFHISHLKAAGRKNWHTVIAKVLKMIGSAKEEGLDISFDAYPYCAGSTALYTLLPPRLMEGGMEETLRRLKDGSVRKSLIEELKNEQEDWDNLIASTGWERVVIAGGQNQGNTGKNVARIAGERGIGPEECMIELMLENQGDVPIVFHSMCQEDMEAVLNSKDSMVISDALYSEGGIPHPRRYGSFARFLCRYGNKMGIEKAVQKITSGPARRLGLEGRGCLAQGMQADIVVLDYKRYRDTATYEVPVCYPEGIRFVIVNGHVAYEEGEGVKGWFGDMIRG